MDIIKITLTLVAYLCVAGCAQNPVYLTESDNARQSKISPRQYFLPTGLLNIKITREAGGAEKLTKISVTPKIIADTRRAYYLYRDHSYWYDDNYIIQTDDYSLLTSINTTNTFRGGEIVEAVGAIGGAIAKFAAKAVPADITCPEILLDIDIDPYGKASDEVNKEYFQNNKCIDVTICYAKLSDGTLPASAKAILYRTIKFFPITIKTKDGNSQQTLYVGIPNREKVEEFSVDRGYFVNREVNLNFKSGILTKDETKYPSEILGFLSLPLKLLNQGSLAITGRFDSRTTELRNEKAYLDALKQRDETEKLYLDALKQRNEALRAP